MTTSRTAVTSRLVRGFNYWLREGHGTSAFQHFTVIALVGQRHIGTRRFTRQIRRHTTEIAIIGKDVNLRRILPPNQIRASSAHNAGGPLNGNLPRIMQIASHRCRITGIQCTAYVG